MSNAQSSFSAYPVPGNSVYCEIGFSERILGDHIFCLVSSLGAWSESTLTVSPLCRAAKATLHSVAMSLFEQGLFLGLGFFAKDFLVSGLKVIRKGRIRSVLGGV